MSCLCLYVLYVYVSLSFLTRHVSKILEAQSSLYLKNIEPEFGLRQVISTCRFEIATVGVNQFHMDRI